METPLMTVSPNTLPPPLRRSDVTLEAIHLCTGVPMDLLEGYAAGRFKPAKVERLVLTRFAQHTKDESMLFFSMHVDKVRCQLLRKFLPPVVFRQIVNSPTADEYRRRLMEECHNHPAELEVAIVNMARREYGYDPTPRRK